MKVFAVEGNKERETDEDESLFYMSEVLSKQ